MRRDHLLWIILGALLLVVVILITHHDTGEVAGLSLDQFARFASLLAILVLIGGGVLMRFRLRVSDALVAIGFWVALAVLLAVFYTYREPLMQMVRRVTAELVPGYPAYSVTDNSVTVEVLRGAGGGFAVRAAVNGVGVSMLVDTGASSVVLTREAAQAVGLPVDILRYDVPMETANGRARAASVVLDNVIVGGIVERAVPALVSAPGVLRTSLLGMSFLSRLEAFEFRGDRLVMRGTSGS